jgi:hypothetical protein
MVQQQQQQPKRALQQQRRRCRPVLFRTYNDTQVAGRCAPTLTKVQTRWLGFFLFFFFLNSTYNRKTTCTEERFHVFKNIISPLPFVSSPPPSLLIGLLHADNCAEPSASATHAKPKFLSSTETEKKEKAKKNVQYTMY